MKVDNINKETKDKNKNKETNKIEFPLSGKALSLYTTCLTYIIGIIYYLIATILSKSIPTREETITLIIFLLGLNSVTANIDLSIILDKYKGKKN